MKEQKREFEKLVRENRSTIYTVCYMFSNDQDEVAEFKNRLENQEIVSQRLLKQATTGKVSWIKKYNVWVSIAGIFFLPIVAFVRQIEEFANN